MPSRDDTRAVTRPYAILVGFDEDIERLRIDIAFFHQQRFERARAQVHVGEMAAFVIVRMIVVVAHGR